MSDEAVPRRARLARAAQPPALRRLHRPRRHGAAVHRRRGVLGLPARAATCASRPGQTRAGRRLRRHATCAPTSRHRDDGRRAWRRSTFGAVLDVRQRRQARRDAARRARLLPVDGERRFGPVGRFFEGEATSEVGLKAGLRARHLDRDRRPTSTRSSRSSTRATRSSRRPPTIPHDAGRRARRRSPRSSSGSRSTTAAARRPTTFRVIVSPLVTWIWLGALVIVGGGAHRAVARGRPGAPPRPGGLRGPRRAGARRASARARAEPSPSGRPDGVEVLVVVAVLVALCAVVFVVSQPLRRGPEAMERQTSERVARPRGRHARRSTARSATPSSMRGTGKLTPEDHRGARPPAARRGDRDPARARRARCG